MRREFAYPVPFLFVLMALIAADADPERPISRSIPIALGPYQWHVVSILILLACGLYLWLKRNRGDRLPDRDEDTEPHRHAARD